MRQLIIGLGLLCLPACDALWTWTASCDSSDPACTTTSSSADMAMPSIEDLAAASPADLTGQPAPPDMTNTKPDMSSPPDASTPLPDGSTTDGGGLLTDSGTVDIDMKVVVLLKDGTEKRRSGWVGPIRYGTGSVSF